MLINNAADGKKIESVEWRTDICLPNNMEKA